MKSPLYITATVLPGNKIEIQTPNLSVGQNVEIVVLVPEVSVADSPDKKQNISLKQRQDFLKLSITERRSILESQAETMLTHYQQNSEWQELMTGDIIDY
ncbi:hypothetical protein MEN41_09280 [Dolichospermum sp. ST_con]|jgi:phosphopantetheine adenylyltransferase|nr:hypothetical protein [Dolichospermum sp. ST_con]MDD1418486.1 hypothetical protein [Dolichospermum sp. ST_sed1]MDD1425458.1 hypothetical protein [Dolichospermum sp. ST_sed9]MDD1432051.1 hypothetical protein [Dolichospermum sp. ST_sed6]MDD1438226.1 hypothetical protein [Dolichospermum sp. ST_sed10]MDD1441415.1 hypothetical protein [Dolichospermum sp. ST_sed3]MDD1447208.1 hypothetical protein [Dolichospermum sp. ST_sed8]MDD1455552.1 hypothetical protein [Dolichospermum sp. ST_sed7]MDD146135